MEVSLLAWDPSVLAGFRKIGLAQNGPLQRRKNAVKKKTRTESLQILEFCRKFAD